MEITQEFNRLWIFPNCLGAPSNSGSFYLNYKKSFSIVLLVVYNAKYEFALVDVGESGKIVIVEYTIAVF